MCRSTSNQLTRQETETVLDLIRGIEGAGLSTSASGKPITDYTLSTWAQDKLLTKIWPDVSWMGGYACVNTGQWLGITERQAKTLVSYVAEACGMRSSIFQPGRWIQIYLSYVAGIISSPEVGVTYLTTGRVPQSIQMIFDKEDEMKTDFARKVWSIAKINVFLAQYDSIRDGNGKEPSELAMETVSLGEGGKATFEIGMSEFFVEDGIQRLRVTPQKIRDLVFISSPLEASIAGGFSVDIDERKAAARCLFEIAKAPKLVQDNLLDILSPDMGHHLGILLEYTKESMPSLDLVSGRVALSLKKVADCEKGWRKLKIMAPIAVVGALAGGVFAVAAAAEAAAVAGAGVAAAETVAAAGATAVATDTMASVMIGGALGSTYGLVAAEATDADKKLALDYLKNGASRGRSHSDIIEKVPLNGNEGELSALALFCGINLFKNNNSLFNGKHIKVNAKAKENHRGVPHWAVEANSLGDLLLLPWGNRTLHPSSSGKVFSKPARKFHVCRKINYTWVE